MSLGLRSFVQESSQRSSNISWFDYVQFACASTQSQFEPRFYEGKSFSSIMPSISKVMKVYHSSCQEWGLKVISQRYDLMSSRPSDTRSVPIPVGDAAVLEKTLRSALESYAFQLRTLTALFRFSSDSARFPWNCGLCGDKKRRTFPQSHGAFRHEGSEAPSVVRSYLPAGGFICACHYWRSSTCRKGCVLI